MTKERLYRYLRGETTSEEREAVLRWLNASPENMQTFHTMRSVYDALLCGQENLNLSPKVVISRPRRRRPAAVAVAAITCVCLCAATFLLSPFLHDPQTVTTTVTRNSIDVITTLAGQRSELSLADGTHIWLGSNSRLRLAPDGNSRRVTLSGEAFFDVAKDSLNPFIVDTDGRRVTVYGTEFNVKSYPHDHHMSVQLYRGSVSVTDTAIAQTVELEPGQQAAFSHRNFCVAEFDTIGGSPLWIHGIHSFQNCTYSEILTEMSNVFDLKLNVRGRWAKKERCTGKFHEADGIESMLSTLQIVRNFSYEWDPETRELTIN